MTLLNRKIARDYDGRPRGAPLRFITRLLHGLFRARQDGFMLTSSISSYPAHYYVRL